MRRRWQGTLRCGSFHRLAALVALLAVEAAAETSSYFGSEQPLQIQPEIDVYYNVSSDFRLLGQLQSTFIPADSYSGMRVGAFADWMLANRFRPLLSPDLAKTRALNLRFGLLYSATIDPGTLNSSQTIYLQEDITPHYFLPWEILISSRNRFQEQWSLSSGDSFYFLLPWPHSARAGVQHRPRSTHALHQRPTHLVEPACNVDPVPNGGRPSVWLQLVWNGSGYRSELLRRHEATAQPQLDARPRNHLVHLLLDTYSTRATGLLGLLR